MTPLKTLILSLLYQFGPMRDVEIWQKTDLVAITPVTYTCIELESQGLIELPSGVRPTAHEWQLTPHGREFVESQSKEVRFAGN